MSKEKGKDKEKREKKAFLEGEEITEELLSRVIHLARLDPDAPEMAVQKEHLRRILDYFRVLSEVELDEGSVPLGVNSAELLLREDEAVGGLSQEEALSNAKHKSGKFFLAPRIMEGEEEG